jgi:hypothetical protein
VHISNRSVDLEPIVMLLARRFGFYAARIDDDPGSAGGEADRAKGAASSNWILLSHNEEFMTAPPVVGVQSAPRDYPPGIRIWTDEDSSVLRLLHF